ncbi:class I SAM-dependent methyltransferase [Bradyrhizobium sp. RDT10]
MSESDSIRSSVATYYASKLAAHGPTPQGSIGMALPHTSCAIGSFFVCLTAFLTPLLDLGCGFGDFFRFLRAEGHRGRYIGYDIAPDMIAEALRLHGQGADRQWRVGAQPEEGADFAIASGILNVKGDAPVEVWERYVLETIDILAHVGRRGFAFNVLSLSSDPERRAANLYYADASKMLSYCLGRYGRSVALLQDYGLYEFTVIVRHP